VSARRAALVELGNALRALDYRFVTVTPVTHARVVERRKLAAGVRDVFGWNLPFEPTCLPAHVWELGQRAEIFVRDGDSSRFRSKVRFSTLDSPAWGSEHSSSQRGVQLFAHGAYPTTESDAVFLGPDSYRFCELLRRDLKPCTCVVDVGCGSGVGGILAASRAERVILVDINDAALELARVNVALASVPAEVRSSNVLGAVNESFDAVIANPPYLRDVAGRVYRDGGGTYGEGLAVRIVREALERLSNGGQLVLYTGVTIVDGVDVLRRAIEPLCEKSCSSFEYFEMDPDVFGEELDEAGYRGAEYERIERIAVVGLRAVVKR
jgi:release factor glutamine methyltransferase